MPILNLYTLPIPHFFDAQEALWATDFLGIEIPWNDRPWLSEGTNGWDDRTEVMSYGTILIVG